MSSPSSSPIVKIYMVRHAETNENKNGTIQGHLDTTLNEVGLQQARLVADKFKDIPLTSAFTSDLTRAKHTTEIILEYHPSVATKMLAQQELRERYQGERQRAKYGESLYKDSHAEAPEKFLQRIMLWRKTTLSKTLLENASGTDVAHVLAVSHAALIAKLVETLLDEKTISPFMNSGPPTIWNCKNTSVTTIELGRDGKGVLIGYSDVSHLDPHAPALQTNAGQAAQG